MNQHGGYYDVAELTWLHGHPSTLHVRGKAAPEPLTGQEPGAAALLFQPFYDAMVPSSSDPLPLLGDYQYFGAGLAGALQSNMAPDGTLSVAGAGDDKGFDFDPSTTSSADGNGSLSLPPAEDNPAPVRHERFPEFVQRNGCGEALKRRGDREGRPSSTISTAKKSRTAASHNQSERRRRDKINQKMKILQKLVPNSSKTDKASLLDEAISYVKQLHAQLQVMRAVTGIDPHLMTMMMMTMMPTMPMQQQQQLHWASKMAYLASLPAAAHMSGGFDLNSFPPPPPPLPPAFAPPAPFPPFAASPWDTTPAAAAQDGNGNPLSAFMAFHAKEPNIFSSESMQKPAMDVDESSNDMAAGHY